jgi:hypothetical protein
MDVSSVLGLPSDFGFTVHLDIKRAAFAGLVYDTAFLIIDTVIGIGLKGQAKN